MRQDANDMQANDNNNESYNESNNNQEDYKPSIDVNDEAYSDTVLDGNYHSEPLDQESNLDDAIEQCGGSVEECTSVITVNSQYSTTGLYSYVPPLNKKVKMFFFIMIFLLIGMIVSAVAYCVNISLSRKDSFEPFDILNNKNLSDNRNITNNAVNPNGPKIVINEVQENETKMDPEQIYAEVSPSVVGIRTYDTNVVDAKSYAVQGSGIVISKDGYIITNSHVVRDSKRYNVDVITNDNNKYKAIVVGYDPRTDLAVLKINADNLTPAKFGNSDKVRVGAGVIAIGNPGGLEFASSLTRGIVSAINRNVGAEDSIVKYIQTDAAINPGNSGGALINKYGQIIGINARKFVASGYEGIGFAIPINTAKPIIDDLITKGYVTGRVILGVSISPLSTYEAMAYKVPGGLIIAAISEESDLKTQGVQVKDIITEINGVKVYNMDSVYAQLEKFRAGDKAKIKYIRPSSINKSNREFEAEVILLEDKGGSQNR